MMEIKSAIIIERVALRRKQLRTMARFNEIGKKLIEKYGETEEEVFKNIDGDLLMLVKERSRLEGVIDFLNDLLKEEDVNSEDYGIQDVVIG